MHSHDDDANNYDDFDEDGEDDFDHVGDDGDQGGDHLLNPDIGGQDLPSHVHPNHLEFVLVKEF